MTTDITRKAQTGEPTANGGHFGSTPKADGAENLLTARNPALDGYPTELEDPTIHVYIGGSHGDDTAVTIVVETPDGLQITAANEVDEGNDEGLTATADITDGEYTYDNDTTMRVLDFAIAKQNEANQLVKAASATAVQNAKAAIVAKLTGSSAGITDTELEDTIRRSGEARGRAERDLQNAAAVLLAREVKRAIPEAAHVEPSTDAADGDVWVNGAHVYDAEFKHIATFGQEEDEDVDAGVRFNDSILGLARSVGIDYRGSHWAQAFALDQDDPKISIAKTETWTPAP